MSLNLLIKFGQQFWDTLYCTCQRHATRYYVFLAVARDFPIFVKCQTLFGRPRVALSRRRERARDVNYAYK